MCFLRASSWSRIPAEVVYVRKMIKWTESTPIAKTHKDDVAEPSRREQQVNPAFNLGDLDVKPRGDDTRLVQSAFELNNDLSGTMVIYDLELADII